MNVTLEIYRADMMVSEAIKKRDLESFRRKSLDRLGTLSLSNGPESRRNKGLGPRRPCPGASREPG